MPHTTEMLFIQNGEHEELAMSSADGHSLQIMFNLLCGRNGNAGTGKRLTPQEYANYLAMMAVDFGLYLGEGTQVVMRDAQGNTLKSEEIHEHSVQPLFSNTADYTIARQAKQAAEMGLDKLNSYAPRSGTYYAYEWGWLQGSQYPQRA